MLPGPSEANVQAGSRQATRLKGTELSLTELDTQGLRKCVLLHALSHDVVSTLLGERTPMVLEKGQVLFQHGDPADAFFIVLDGWIKLYRLNSEGEETVVHLFKTAESFAEGAMFSGGVYPVSAEAATSARVQAIPAAAVRKAIEQDPGVAFAMLGATSRHLHQLVDQIEQLKRSNGPQRIAEFLIELCPADRGEVRVDLPFEKVLIAARLGMTPESLSRGLAKLRPLGVASRGAQIIVGDCHALRNFVADHHGAA